MVRKLNVSLLSLSLCLAPRISRASGLTTLPEFLSRLATQQKSIRDIQFDFEQTLTVRSTQKSEESLGKAFFKTPNRFRIEKFLPSPQTFVCNGKKLWIYTPEFKQVLVRTWKGWARSSRLPQGFLNLQNYLEELEKDFDLSLENPGRPAAYLLVAKPKKTDQNQSLKIWIGESDLLPTRMESESVASFVQTQILKPLVNQDLSDQLFKLTLAPDIAVVPL